MNHAFAGRSNGVLLHITSLPSRFCIGDLGPAAYEFADFLRRAGQSFWQILPLNYTTATTWHSPYNCFSAFAGNPLLISPELLYRDGLLGRDETEASATAHGDRINYSAVKTVKHRFFRTAFENFRADRHGDYEQFIAENASWLGDFAIFAALKRRLGAMPWFRWSREIRDRKNHGLESVRRELKDQIRYEEFLQYIFHRQYQALRNYCKHKGVRIIGDMPIYVSQESSDVWADPKMFKLDAGGRPRYITGVPPDCFSRTGQLWGNPVYNWRRLEADGYAWWIRRIRHSIRLFDLVRIDHFRGFVAYWEIPAGSRTAAGGRWVKAPAEKFFDSLLGQIPSAPIIAEDLGYITEDVKRVMRRFGFPGMRVLQFGFDGNPADNCHCPFNHTENCLVYTGTHDNNTARGWFRSDATDQQRKRLSDYTGMAVSAANVHRCLALLAMGSVAKAAIIPMQDILGLGGEARMNHPAKKTGNWRWRLRPNQLKSSTAAALRHMTEVYGRLQEGKEVRK